MAGPIRMKRVRKAATAVLGFGAAAWFLPWLTAFFAATGLIDVLRNERRSWDLFDRYFLGNGFTVWLLSPINLIVDLLCYRNRKVYRLDDFPDEVRREIDAVLAAFAARRSEIIGQVDKVFGSARRGMYVYRWFGKRYNADVPEFDRDFRYIQTIAVSVFEGQEATSYHFGPLRMTLRLLYNLTPVRSDRVFIECGGTKHFWHDDPLFIFDDTLMHRSVNEEAGRRYCVFVDVLRPTPVPGLLSALLRVASAAARRSRALFYKKWTMLGATDAPQGAASKP